MTQLKFPSTRKIDGLNYSLFLNGVPFVQLPMRLPEKRVASALTDSYSAE